MLVQLLKNNKRRIDFMPTLAVKYRPKVFDEVVGQQAGVQVMRAIAERKSIQVVLLQGHHGIGKTTLARIFAKSINCDYGVKLCGECPSCKAFDRDSHPDIIEMDIGSSGLVADARKMISQAKVVPTWKARVFILDEIHSGSTEFFDSLLDLFEEPPPSAYFVGCTTQSESIPLTIISRALVVELSSVRTEEIQKRLALISQQEGFQFDARILEAVARHASGSIRDAIMSLERLMLRSEVKTLSFDLLEAEGWFISLERIHKILRSLLTRDFKTYLAFTKVGSRLEAVNTIYEVLDKLSRFYLKKQRNPDVLTDALWKGYIRILRGADPSLAFRGVWLESGGG